MLLKFRQGGSFLWRVCGSIILRPAGSRSAPVTPLTPRAAPLWWRESHALQPTVNSQLDCFEIEQNSSSGLGGSILSKMRRNTGASVFPRMVDKSDIELCPDLIAVSRLVLLANTRHSCGGGGGSHNILPLSKPNLPSIHSTFFGRASKPFTWRWPPSHIISHHIFANRFSLNGSKKIWTNCNWSWNQMEIHCNWNGTERKVAFLVQHLNELLLWYHLLTSDTDLWHLFSNVVNS